VLFSLASFNLNYFIKSVFSYYLCSKTSFLAIILVIKMACPKNNLMSTFSTLIISYVQIVMSHFFSSQNLEFISVSYNLAFQKETEFGICYATLR